MRHLLFTAVLPLMACRTHEAAPAILTHAPTAAPPEPVAIPSDSQPNAPTASAAPAIVEPAVVERVAVRGDANAWIVRGPNGVAPHIVFMPGVCSNARAYLLGMREAARAHGGMVAIDGDRPCGDPSSGLRSFSWDSARQRARLQAALAAAGVHAPPPEGLTLVGYSAGAGIGELMAQRWPREYTRLVLIGAPSDPSVVRLAEARAVVTMSCSEDVPTRMRTAADRLVAKGIRATYFEMPGCTHPDIADGERVFRAVFDWLDATARSVAE